MPKNHSSDGLLIVGHGTREPAGIEQFRCLLALVLERLSPRPVEAGFLEFAEPTIAEGIASLANMGAGRIKVVPLLLFAAGHVKEDIPRQIREATQRYPALQIELAPSL